MKQFKIILILLNFLIFFNLIGQPNLSDPMLYQRYNTLDINRVRTIFNNTGLLCDGNEQNIPLARPPAFEYPNGSGISYGTAVGIVIGAPGNQDAGVVGGVNLENLAYLDATLDEGPAAFWDEEHFAPYPEVTGNDKAALSSDPTTWPTNGWPSIIPGTNQNLLVGSEGWPGMGSNGERLADQETYSVMYSWQGTDLGDTDRRWLRTSMEMRGLAWTGELYQDFIVWIFIIRNNGDATIKDMRAGIHSDFGYLPLFNSPTSTGDDDRHYYRKDLQLAYGTDDNGYEDHPNGGSLAANEIAHSGTVALRMPGASKKVETYDAFHFWMEAVTPRGNGASKELYYKYNLANLEDQHDSDNDGIDDDFDENGVPDELDGGPGYFLGFGSDGLQVIGSGAFDLAPGESDTLIFATVFAMNEKELIKNTKNVITLYQNKWEVVKAPQEPQVEVVAGDGKNTIYWNKISEQDEQFEGYKIYRSLDGGVTWGSESFKDFNGATKYIPLAQFDKIDGIEGYYKTLPEFAWFNLGEESGLPNETMLIENLSFFNSGDSVRYFVDDNVVNGAKYRYYVAAYDTGNAITGPLENTAASIPKVGSNTVEVVPSAPAALSELKNVRVVPNPYFVASGWEIGNENQIQITGLPSNATIKIFNTAGELVKTINHEANNSIAESIAQWDLKNEDQQLVASGLYFFYVDSSIGSAQGKFVIIL
ncbi:MAG: T9SS type A sorting domain-containing protein [Ignavibacteriae bacterium]|nr:T9SS type A sorting domain-containing protein [Ignavibacteriota bacterium]